MVPALNGRVAAACSISLWKEKCICPASGVPMNLPFSVVRTGRCNLPSFHDGPSSSGVTAKGANADGGFDWTKPNPVPTSLGTIPRRLMSFSRTTSFMYCSASAAVVPCGTRSRITPISDSKSSPSSSFRNGISAVGAKKLSLAP